MELCPLHRAGLRFIQSFITGMNIKGKKMRLNHSDSVIYCSKSLVWNQISYFNSYWKRSLIVIGRITGRALGGHLLHPSLLQDLHPCGSLQMFIYTALNTCCKDVQHWEQRYLFLRTPGLQSQIQTESSALSCFIIFLMHPCCRERREKKLANLSTICWPKLKFCDTTSTHTSDESASFSQRILSTHMVWQTMLNLNHYVPQLLFN